MIRGKNQYKVHAFEKLNCINQVIHYESVFYYHTRIYGFRYCSISQFQSNVTRVDNVLLRIVTVICNCEVISVKLALVPHLMQNLMRTENSQCIVTLCLKTINLLYAFNFLL